MIQLQWGPVDFSLMIGIFRSIYNFPIIREKWSFQFFDGFPFFY